jgi:hypothetical protein
MVSWLPSMVGPSNHQYLNHNGKRLSWNTGINKILKLIYQSDIYKYVEICINRNIDVEFKGPWEGRFRDKDD